MKMIVNVDVVEIVDYEIFKCTYIEKVIRRKN